jgi:hypothetical protein
MADIKLTVSPEMIEAWMTVEDAVEVASWHMKATTPLSKRAAPLLAPVLQGVSGPSAKPEGAGLTGVHCTALSSRSTRSGCSSCASCGLSLRQSQLHEAEALLQPSARPPKHALAAWREAQRTPYGRPHPHTCVSSPGHLHHPRHIELKR